MSGSMSDTVPVSTADPPELTRTIVQTLRTSQESRSMRVPGTLSSADLGFAAFVFTSSLLAGLWVRKRLRLRQQRQRAAMIGSKESQSSLPAPASTDMTESAAHVVPTMGDVVFVAVMLTYGGYLGRLVYRYFEQRQRMLDDSSLVAPAATSLS